MATYTVSVSKTATLIGGTPDTVRFPSAFRLEIYNHSSTTFIWVRWDGTDPTVEGDNSVPVSPGGVRVIHAPAQEIRLIASSPAKYTVTVAGVEREGGG